MPAKKTTDQIVDITALTSIAQALADGASVRYDGETHASICGVCGARIFGPALDLSVQHMDGCLVPQAIAALTPVTVAAPSVPAMGEE